MLPRISIFLFTCHVISFLIFIFGFLPLKPIDREIATTSSLPRELNGIPLDVKQLYQPRIQRLVFIIIDALRYDFIKNNKLKEQMPFLWTLQNNGIACVYKAEAHTPTVTLPRIKAMVMGSTPSFADVILNLGSPQLSEDNLIFQLRAYNHKLIFYGDETWLKLFPNLFERSEGTTSFFVNDYTQVDLNVTRNLKQELNQTDWSVMVLHYLGLDHIGHISGPKSRLILPKLKEMDNVIQEIFQSFHQNNTLMVICGDHGISDSGSHGGSSPAEVEVPLVFIMKGCEPDSETYLQIDLTATIALLLGVPLPKGNLGSILPGILRSLPKRQKVYAAYVNAKSIAARYNANFEDTDYQLAIKWYEDWLMQGEEGDPGKIVELFLHSARRMSNRVLASLASFDLYAMLMGIILSFQVFFCFSYKTVLRTARVGSLSILYILWIISIAGHVTTCLLIGNNSALCFKETPTLPALVLITTLLTITAYLSYLIFLTASFDLEVVCSTAETFLASGTAFHAISMAASSFVEEEHQTYYYLVTTLTAILALCNVRKNGPVLPLVGTLIGLRIGRMWNQTGDKWINEPDVEGWLNRPEHTLWLIISSILGVVGIFVWIKRNLRLTSVQLICTVVCLTAALAYRAAIGTFGCSYPASLGVAEAAVGYVSLVGLAAFSKDGSSTILTIWILLTSMLKRAHNLILTCLQLAQYSFLRPTLKEHLSPFYYGLTHYWIGMAWYFQQGNGNNLARIDLASGYVGLSYYNATLVGFFLSCATFSGPVLAFLLANHTARDSDQLYGFLWPRIVIAPIFLVALFALRYHLFVWTVFSPKLLYESAISSLILLLLISKNILS